MKRVGFWCRFPCLLTAMTATSLPYATSAQSIATTPNSVIRPGALNDIPQHLAEIGWDTDVPSLFVIRFQPEKMNFDPGWSSWVTEAMLKRTGFMTRPRIDPWPPIFAGNGSFVSMSGGQLSPQDMQAFQAWCLRRSQVIPPIIVHAIPYVAPISGQSARLLPLGVQPGQPRVSQRVVGIGFAETIGLTLPHNADDDAVTVPPEVIAALPPMGVSLETRLRWSDPVPGDNPMTSAVVPVAMMVPGEPVSLRLVADRRVLWEHRYGAPAPAVSASQQPQAKSSPASAPVGAPDIKF